VRADLGPVTDHLNRNVPDLKTGSTDSTRRLGKKNRPGGSSPLRFARAEIRAQVPQASSRKQGIRGSMGNHIGIRMPLKRTFTGEEHSPKPHLAC
jgi:hypothetical protein